ncbi:MAG TPA: phospholipase D-like domain-containing protein [Longimicrobiaceae bacterium]|nr:phospholipase D-like domain-containing protein [Longimicrobiaceae bacterium]
MRIGRRRTRASERPKRLPRWRELDVEQKRHYRWWAVLFFVIGVLATAGALLALFSPFGQRAEHVFATARPPVGSPPFLAALSGATNAPVRRGGTAELLSNGDEFLPAILRDLRAARRSIDFMVYIWEPGEVSDSALRVLTERARAGVQVRVVLDGVGALNAPEEGFRELREAGGRVARFHPLRFGELTRFHRRNHRRAIVIDGEVGYTGGAAVGDKWLGDARGPDEWREDVVRVTGPLALSLQAAFAQTWAVTTGEILAGPAFYPPEPDPVVAPAAASITLHVGVTSSPSDEQLPLRKVFWLTFAAARERLYVTNAYFVPDHALLRALAERARAGVDVRVLVPGPITDARPVRWASQAHYLELLEAGVRIWEYQGTMLHTKSLVVDGVWSVVGSSNLDIRSTELNQENVLGIVDAGFGAQVERAFLRDLERAEEVRLEEWRRRPWWKKVREEGAELFDEQF